MVVDCPGGEIVNRRAGVQFGPRGGRRLHVDRRPRGSTSTDGRDRVVLSRGHSSLTLYIQLYLSGYGPEPADPQDKS
nr:hypothetical protein [Actinoplanes ferrugineus]